ncbi:MAG: hypothetical protein U5L96_00815 [Owenweeksia sp.]|nr:hypothetical protein [Owenweeksia sp.]
MARQIKEQVPLLKKRYQKLIFVGFNALNTAEESILLQLYREGLAHFYWDVDDYYFKDKNQEAGHFLRESKLVRERSGKGGFSWASSIAHGAAQKDRPTGGKVVITYKPWQPMLRYCSTSHGAPEEVAVALADEELLPLFLNNLPSEVESLNITMGLPLRHTPVAGFFDLLLSMFRQQEVSERTDKHGNPAYHHQSWDDPLGHFSEALDGPG